MFEIVLNRLRGTGDIFKVFSFAITGNILYAAYIALVIGLLSTWYYGLVAGLLYMLGESMGWGKWVGSLCHPESIISLEDRYADNEGIKFPFVHQTANLIVKEREDYELYCQVALGLRGFYWWISLYVFMAFIGLVSYYEAIIISILLGITFPIAAYISTKLDYNGKFWIINYSKGWENQELIYGLFQGIAMWYIMLQWLN